MGGGRTPAPRCRRTASSPSASSRTPRSSTEEWSVHVTELREPKSSTPRTRSPSSGAFQTVLFAHAQEPVTESNASQCLGVFPVELSRRVDELCGIGVGRDGALTVGRSGSMPTPTSPDHCGTRVETGPASTGAVHRGCSATGVARPPGRLRGRRGTRGGGSAPPGGACPRWRRPCPASPGQPRWRSDRR